MEGKRRSARIEQKRARKRRLITLVRYIILLAIISIVSYMAYGMYKESKVGIKAEQGDIRNAVLPDYTDGTLNEETKKDEDIKKPETPVAKKYKGYKVESRLEIPKIKLNTNVLLDYSEDGLEICASKYYGPTANEEGNYCIAAHNYNKKNMFNHLIDLQIGDELFLTDNDNGIIEYQIYDIYKVKPENTEPLSQTTRGKREITLITCVNYSQNRLVVKAIEKEKKV